MPNDWMTRYKELPNKWVVMDTADPMLMTSKEMRVNFPFAVVKKDSDGFWVEKTKEAAEALAARMNAGGAPPDPEPEPWTEAEAKAAAESCKPSAERKKNKKK